MPENTSLNINSKLVFALYKKVFFKSFVCMVFQEGILCPVEFIHWILSLKMPCDFSIFLGFLPFFHKCHRTDPDACISWFLC